MKFGSLFAGIGGFDRGFEQVGWECRWQVETDKFCLSRLQKHWPHVRKGHDVREWPTADTEWVDVICGGFPCQDISCAGTRNGIKGQRSGLWHEMFRIIRTLRPRYAVMENVSALRIRGLDRVLGDMASIGYCSEWQSVRASDFALPHRRERIIIVSYPDEFHESQGVGNRQADQQTVFPSDYCQRAPIHVATTTSADRVDHGVSRRLYRYGVGAYGNAICPQKAKWVAELIDRHWLTFFPP